MMMIGTLAFAKPTTNSNLVCTYACMEVTGPPNFEKCADGEDISIPVKFILNSTNMTPEERGTQRKLLHLATLINLRDELLQELNDQAQVMSAENFTLVHNQVLKDFDAIIEEDRNKDPAHFRIDAEYKNMASDAIEAKSMAVRKIQIFRESAQAGCEPTILDRILARPIMEFSRQTAVLELRTGLRDFPWADVAAGGEIVRFGDWSPAQVEPWKLALVAQALAADAGLRAVRVAAHELRLPPAGWAAEEVVWDGCAAVRASPSTAALLLRNCTRLRSLSLRCTGPASAARPLATPATAWLTRDEGRDACHGPARRDGSLPREIGRKGGRERERERDASRLRGVAVIACNTRAAVAAQCPARQRLSSGRRRAGGH